MLMKKILMKNYGNIATSLKREFGKEFEREEIIGKILEKIEDVIKKLI